MELDDGHSESDGHKKMDQVLHIWKRRKLDDGHTDPASGAPNTLHVSRPAGRAPSPPRSPPSSVRLLLPASLPPLLPFLRRSPR